MLKIFTEASYGRGFGHLSRMSCILEKARKINIDAVIFLDTEGEFNNIFQQDNIVVTDWLSTGFESRNAMRDDIIVVDSYHIDADRIKMLNRAAQKVVVIDDNIRLDYECTIVVNPNYYGEYLSYPSGKNNEYFVGKDYTLLREAFTSPEDRNARADVQEILISFGGTDVQNMTEKIISSVKHENPDTVLNVVVTSAFTHLPQIRSMLSTRDSLVVNADSNQMASLMRRVDFAITSAGGTSNELIKSQCPGLIIPVVENQYRNAKLLHEHQLAIANQIIDQKDIATLFKQSARASLITNMKSKESSSSAADFILSMCI